MLNLRAAWRLLMETSREWWRDKAPQLAAAVAFYAMLSISPLLLICLAVIGAVFGREAAKEQVVNYLQRLMGAQGAAAAYEMLRSASTTRYGLLATLISGAILLFSASGVFAQLHSALNAIWKTRAATPEATWWQTIWARIFSFTMVLVVSFLMLVSLVISTVITGITEYMQGVAPWMAFAGGVLDTLISLGVFTVMFGLLFKYVPDAPIAWGDVRVGAVVTTVLFLVGKYALGWYLSHSKTTSVYGAAGSLVAMLLWVYYTAQILFFGAEMTQVYARRHASPTAA